MRTTRAQLNNSMLQDHILRLRYQIEASYAGLLDRSIADEEIEQDVIRLLSCVYTTTITLWTFVLRILDPDNSGQNGDIQIMTVSLGRELSLTFDSNLSADPLLAMTDSPRNLSEFSFAEDRI